MGLRIKTNVVSLNARNKLKENQGKRNQDALEQLSCGQCINRFATKKPNAAIAVPDGMKVHIDELGVIYENIQAAQNRIVDVDAASEIFKMAPVTFLFMKE